jgi:putative endonuclease
MKGFMYILKCADNTYYTGSTIDLQRRLEQHQRGEGANFTRKRRPVELVYFEEYSRIDEAFYREKQVQGWSKKKKEALINGDVLALHKHAICRNITHHSTARLGSTRRPGCLDSARRPSFGC